MATFCAVDAGEEARGNPRMGMAVYSTWVQAATANHEPLYFVQYIYIYIFRAPSKSGLLLYEIHSSRGEIDLGRELAKAGGDGVTAGMPAGCTRVRCNGLKMTIRLSAYQI